MRFLLILFFSCLILLANAQDKLGIANSNYSPSNSIHLNPATSTNSKTFFHINWVGLSTYAFTNQAYIPKFSVWSKTLQTPQLSKIKENNFLYSNNTVDGPCFVWSYKDLGIATYVRGRAMVDVRNIPYELVIAISENDTTYLSQHVNLDLKNVKLSEMSWLEYGVNFSKMLHKHGTKIISVGGNLKYLTGINIAYANLNTFKSQIIDTTIDIEKYKAVIRYNTPGWNTGKGVGVDMGFTYTKTLDYVDAYAAHDPKYNCKHIDYKYKIGVSLLDAGFIRFKKNTFQSNIAGSMTINRFTSDSAFYKNFSPTFKENQPIWTVLPTAVSAQLDWNFGYHFYANLTAINSLTTSWMTGVQRQNVIALTPRYERKQFEIALPFALQRYKYPQLGLTIRARNIMLGVDNVLPLVMKTNTSGLGVYFNIGFALYKNPQCWNKRPKRHKNKIFSKGIFYNKEEKKKVGNVDDSPAKDTPKVEHEQDSGKIKTEASDPHKQKINTKRKYFKWLHRRKKNYKESKTT